MMKCTAPPRAPPIALGEKNWRREKVDVGGLVRVLAQGAGAVFGAGVVRNTAARLGAEARPVVKGAVRAGLTAADRVQNWTAEAREQIQDLIEEARADQREATEERRR
jgi:hypothetical protein